jgi:hypothetical protein
MPALKIHALDEAIFAVGHLVQFPTNLVKQENFEIVMGHQGVTPSTPEQATE